MKTSMLKATRTLVKLAAMALLVSAINGCATTGDHQQAFSSKTALSGNSEYLNMDTKQALTASKTVLIKQGFSLDSIDASLGMFKANRKFQDPDDKEYAYNINVSGLVVEESPDRTLMTLSATQQTIVHKEYTKWWKLLWMIPLFPVETKYETVVVREGNIEEKNFYNDFFSSVKAQGAMMKKVKHPGEKPVQAAASASVPLVNAEAGKGLNEAKKADQQHKENRI